MKEELYSVCENYNLYCTFVRPGNEQLARLKRASGECSAGGRDAIIGMGTGRKKERSM